MIIAIASGKGGTGKTTVAVNLALAWGAPVWLLDCDVEEPNAHLFLRSDGAQQEIITVPVPRVDMARCDACGECSRFCVYHAIVAPGTKPLVFRELCHSCGGCARVCPRGAITEVERRIGVIETTEVEGVTLVGGHLDVGVAMSPPLIRAVNARIPHDGVALLDAPPGTSCPVITAIRGADAVVLVTEPTPFGLHDLTLAVEMVGALGLPMGVVVNRIGIGDERVHAFCAAQHIPVLQEIPDDRRIAEAYSQGIPLVKALPEYRAHFRQLADSVTALCTERRFVTQGDGHEHGCGGETELRPVNPATGASTAEGANANIRV